MSTGLPFCAAGRAGEASKTLQTWSAQQRAALGQRLLKDLAEAILRDRHTNPKFEGYGSDKTKAVDSMQGTLELDGYVYLPGAAVG
jgi:hypothetical protein